MYHVVKADPGDPIDEPREGTVLAQREIRACQVCGTKFSATNHIECCPVCLLRGAAGGQGAVICSLDPGSESEPGSNDARPRELATRFENYELAIGENGKPIELGRGAMGITYKAFDVDLRVPVTLKVISERYLSDESARLRFLREARAAASLRHPNVASVFHLGRSGGNYFYAMEFVEGETLGSLIRRSGQLELKQALEIVSQVAAGLAAVHKQNLVHRDIKPTNIMVSLDEGSGVTAKIIDLGLAKSVNEPLFESAISTPGAFAGTPEFASPEQFSGVGVDIRSDLYSLGVTLWEMLIGHPPFRGSPAEVMYQHLHGPLPLGQLEHVQQPVVTLIKSLLDKDPGRRPQKPSELQNLLREVRTALETKGKVKSRGVIRTAAEHRRGEALHRPRPDRMSAAKEALRAETRRPLLEAWDFTPFLAEKLKGFTGRDWVFQEIEAWRRKCSPPALLIVGEPGVGKSTVLAQLIQRNPGGYVLGYHCCRADTPATLDPAGLVRNLAAMISARLDEYAAMLEGPAIVDALARSDSDPASAFDAAILSPLHKIRAPEGGRLYLVIDALDEALERAQRPTIVDVLSTRFDRLPSWIGIVATTRRDPSLLSQLRSLCVHVLDVEDPRNQEDVRHFIQDRLAEPELRDKAQGSGRSVTELATTLLRSSAGNFLFVTTALDAVEIGQLSFDQIEKLPPGLRSLYELFFHRLFRDAGMDFSVARKVLETVAAAREPLTRQQIAAATELDAEDELPLILSRLASFVPASQGRYAFFHKSLFEWLTGWDIQQDQPFAGPAHVNLQKGWNRLATWCWAEYKRSSGKPPLYCLRHLAAHLHQVGLDHLLEILLKDFHFLQAKLESMDVSALIGDYEYLPAGVDLRQTQAAIRLSAHVLARDHRQLAGQLMGRLLGNAAPNIQDLLKEAARWQSWPWLRPLKRSLTPPGGPMIGTLQGHTRMVTAVAVTPDGRYAVTGSWDSTLRVWALDSGQTVRLLEGHAACVTSVAVTLDGRCIVSASEDRTLRVWDLATGQTKRVLEGHTNWAVALAVTPEGRGAVSGSWDGTLRVWDLESGQTVRTLEGHTSAVRAVALTPDGRCALSASNDRTLRVWELESGRTVCTLRGHANVVTAAVVTPDGRRAVSASEDRTLRVWDLKSAQTELVLEGHTGVVTAVAVTPDGQHAVSASWDRTLRVWDLESGQTVRTLEGHTSAVTAVAITPDGQYAVSASDDRTARVWQLEKSQSVGMLEDDAAAITAVAVTPDGRRALFALGNRTLRVCELENGERVLTLEGDTHAVTAVAVTPDGRRAVSALDNHTLRVWDLESGQIERTLEGHTACIRSVVVTPDGRRVLSASDDQTLRVWDLEKDHKVHTLEGHTGAVTAVTVTLDGRLAVSASWDRTLRVWELENDHKVRTLEGHTSAVTAVTVTLDGRLAVSASWDRTLRVWELGSGRIIRTLEGHADWVRSVAVTPDGRLTVSASDDHTLRVWDLNSGEVITTFSGEGAMLNCAVAPDGRTICAGDILGRVHLLRLEGVDQPSLSRPKRKF
jgi:WD40 repeat protein/serine/threonine protein kinase